MATVGDVPVGAIRRAILRIAVVSIFPPQPRASCRVEKNLVRSGMSIHLVETPRDQYGTVPCRHALTVRWRIGVDDAVRDVRRPRQQRRGGLARWGRGKGSRSDAIRAEHGVKRATDINVRPVGENL